MPARNKTPTKSKSPRKTKEKVVEEKDASNNDHMDDDEELADGVDPLDDDLDGDYVANEEEESESDDQESQVIIVMYVTLSIHITANLFYQGNNFIFVQPNLGPPNFFMGMSQGPLDISQNTF